MTSITFNLSAKKRHGTEDSEVLVRFSHKRGVNLRAKTGIFVPARSWNIDKSEIKIPRMHTPEQKKLLHLKNKLEKLKMHIDFQCAETSGEHIDKEWLQKTIFEFHNGPTKMEEEHLDFEQVFTLFLKMQTVCESESKHYKSVLRILKRFELYKGKGYKLDLDTMSDEDLSCFDHFLRIEHTFFDDKKNCIKHKEIYKAYPEFRKPQPRGDNGIFSIMKKIRTFYNWAVNTGRTTNNPFKKYKLKECVYGTPFFMTIEERKKLYEFDFSFRPGLARQRDIFVFQSCIGARIGDLYDLKRENIVNGAIEYIPDKTSDKHAITVRVPLCKQALDILDRYKDLTSGEILPFISKQKYNNAIKEMLRLAGIDRTVTILNPTTREEEQRKLCDVASSHMARRNFIGNLYNQVQDPNAIGAMTGHVEGSKAFSRYRTIDDTIKKRLVSMLE